jgi:hypothetical protein
METETLGTSQEAQAEFIKQSRKKSYTKAGKLTHASFALVDLEFRIYCVENGLKPTRTRAKKYRNRRVK